MFPARKGTHAEGDRAHATRAANLKARAAKTAAASATRLAPSQTRCALLSVAAKTAASLAWRFHELRKSAEVQDEE